MDERLLVLERGPEMTRAEEWRAKAREELELPSGMKIVARRPGALQLAKWGRLPMVLAAAVSGAPGTEPDVDATAEYIREIVNWCLIEPAAPGEIEADEIPAEDLTYLWRWALRVEEARALEGFRGGGRDAGAGGDGADLRAAAIGAAGD